MKKLLPLFILCFSITAFGQKIKLVEGDLSPLKGQTSVGLEMTYNGTRVGKFEKEADYIAQKKSDYNEKEPGKGDNWAKSWEDDKMSRYKPRFTEMFTERAFPIKDDSKYTVIFNTTFIEPGFNVGVMRRNAMINGEALIVETNNKSHVIAKITVEKAPGRTFGGYDYDTGLRIQESYAMAGRELGKFIKSKIK
jgi:hypothetical protein